MFEYEVVIMLIIMLYVIVGLAIALGFGLGFGLPPKSGSGNVTGTVPVSSGGTGRTNWDPNKFVTTNNLGNQLLSLKNVPDGEVVGTTDIQSLSNKNLIDAIASSSTSIEDILKFQSESTQVSKINNLGSFLGPYTLNNNSNTTLNITPDNLAEIIVCDSASATTVNLPNNLPVGFNCKILQKGTGIVSLAADPGATILSKNGSLSLYGQNSIVEIICLENADGFSANYNASGDLGVDVLPVVLVPITSFSSSVFGLLYYNYGAPVNLIGNLASTVTINPHPTSGSYITCTKTIYRVYTQINLQFITQPGTNRTFYNLNITPIASLPADTTVTSGAESTPIGNNNFRQDRKLEWYDCPPTRYINVTVNSNASPTITFNSGYFLLQIAP